MLKTTEQLTDAGFGQRIFSDKELSDFFGGTDARRYGLVSKALKKNEVIRIRRGLYMLAEKYRQVRFHDYYIANKILKNSYVSLESALSYHGWIPEAVTVVTSIVYNRKSLQVDSPVGKFEYRAMPVNDYEFLTDVNRIELNENFILIASPLRALGDLVYDKKMKWNGVGTLIDGLRVDEDEILGISEIDLDNLLRVYKSKRVISFISSLRKEIFK